MQFPSLFSQLLDLFLPPRCLTCQEIVQTSQTVCSSCWSEAQFITAPYCTCCGFPFEYDVPDQALCLNCARKRPPFAQARTVFHYDDFSRQMVLAFKHGDQLDLAPTMATWMVRAGADMLEQCDLIVPVPLHWRRQLSRKFNQAALLSQEISKRTGLPCQTDILKRTRFTAPQGHLSRMARQKNLKGAFDVTRKLDGERILLVDDVFTTGSTILNCCHSLLKNGASEVRVLTFARVHHKDVT